MKLTDDENDKQRMEQERNRVVRCSDVLGRLWLNMTLPATSLASALLYCESHSGTSVKGLGLDFAPSNELVGIALNLDEMNPALGKFLNLLLGIRTPLGVWRRNLIRVRNDIAQFNVGSLVLVPKQPVIDAVLHVE